MKKALLILVAALVVLWVVDVGLVSCSEFGFRLKGQTLEVDLANCITPRGTPEAVMPWYGPIFNFL